MSTEGKSKLNEVYTSEKRIGFAIVDNEVVFQEDNNRINTIEWLKDQYKLTDEDIENTIRGGLFENKITICVGKDYKPIDMNMLSAKSLITIMDKQYKKFGCKCPIAIYNGSVVGNPGVAWSPVEVIGRGYFCKTTD